MYYAPHRLEKKTAPVIQVDDFGRPVIESDVEQWTFVGACRCDKVNESKVKSDNGVAFTPSHKIVLGSRGKVVSGDIVRVLHKGNVICQGYARCPKDYNYYDYSEIWLE